LVPDGSKGAPFDTSKSPLAGFHDYERLQHGISNQVGNIRMTIKCGGSFWYCQHFHHYHHLDHQHSCTATLFFFGQNSE